ncbi:S8 family peptidase [Paenibacillus sp. strain BS8-2]
MRKSWIAAFTIIAIAALLLPATPLFAPRTGTNRETPKSIPFSASKEHKLKLMELQHDLDATELLMTAESVKDFRQVLLASGHSARTASAAIDGLMKEHAHFSYVNWQSSGKSLHRGTIPTTSNGIAKSYLKDAAAKLRSNQSYESKPFVATNKSRYVVIGVPDTNTRGSGVIGIIKQDVIGQVELHQKRNLRLIPYPSEGNYRIESVAPNSTKDITVRNGEDNGNASHYHIRDVVVHFPAQPSEADLLKIKKDVNAEQIQRIGDTYVFRSNTIETKQLMEYFKMNWKPEYTEPHYLYMTNETVSEDTVIPNDTLYSQYQWNLPSIGAEHGWAVSKGDEGVIIAVLDTGVQSNHPDLSDKLISGTNIIDSSASPNDDVGHGTHVAGIIGASVNNGEGVAGVSWYNKIMPVKVLDSSGAGSTYSVAQGIIWAVDHGAKVINMSLGNYAQADFLHDAIKYAYERDVVLIAASGNDNTDRPGYPAAYPEVFAVAATTNNKEKASFSNYGDYIDVAAPGDSIASTYPGSQYAALSGTSMASPHVAALAGLIRSVNPDLTNEEVMEIMRSSAQDLGTDGKDIYFGYGEIDLNKALHAATSFGGALQNFPQKVKRRLAQTEPK